MHMTSKPGLQREAQQIPGERFTCPYRSQGHRVESNLRKHIERTHSADSTQQTPPEEDTFSRDAVNASPTQVFEISKNDDDPNHGQSTSILDAASQGSPESQKTSSAPEKRSVSRKDLCDISTLSLRQAPEDKPSMSNLYEASPSTNPLKRAADGHSGSMKKLAGSYSIDHDRSLARRAKTRPGESLRNLGERGDAGESIVAQTNAMDRKKSLYDAPVAPLGSAGSWARRRDRLSQTRKVYDYDPRIHVFRPKNGSSRSRNRPFADDPKDLEQPVKAQNMPPEDRSVEQNQDTIEPTQADSVTIKAISPEPDVETEPDPAPVMIRQPQTRDISHDQLVVEVKGIYAGLVMVEAKCIDVDEKQSAAALDKATARRTRPTDEQWKAQITLHKTLLHEHHDFFLASQHPKASLALTRMAATYQMPARMWRHGIHAFLEVLRHRLPESLDHMLAFISIAYAMMTLLFETVPMFKDTWIECLGDLGRYRMAIEDNDMRDRETFAGVSRFWYSKASYRNPHVGRLYHHLAILSRPFSLQQLSNYAKALTCVTPFESARGSIMTLFNPVLNGKESSSLRAASFETKIIKAHALQFCNLPRDGHKAIVQEIRDGSLRDHVNKVTSRFKEQGVFLALASIAAILEYGVLRHDGTPKALVWLALRDSIALHEKLRSFNQNSLDTSLDQLRQSEVSPRILPRSSPSIDDLTTKELEASSSTVLDATSLWSVCFLTALQSPQNNNFHPFLHVGFVFLWSLVSIEKGIAYVEGLVPWDDICFFLNTFSKSEVMAAKVEAEEFPQPDEGVGRPLPEDYLMRGQLYSWWYFPEMWFSNANVDDEERVLELPSMAAPRLERILWLGARIAARNRRLRYSPESRKFEVAKYAEDLKANRMADEALLPTPIDQDQEMTDAPSEAATAIKSAEDTPYLGTVIEAEANASAIDEEPSSPKVASQPVKAEHPVTVSWLQGNVLDQAKGPPSKSELESWGSATKEIESNYRFDRGSKASST